MTKLVVENFSCIKHADLEVANFTIIIGEQASGKSLISKLVYFFQGIIPNTVSFFAQEQSILDIEKDLIAKFKEWFPYSAWGNKRFCIYFEAGDFSARIERVSIAKGKMEGLKFSFSEKFIKEYEASLNNIKLSIEAISSKTRTKNADVRPKFPESMRVRYTAAREFKKIFDVPESQIFVPAGRAFFTSVGRFADVFKHYKTIDSVTMEFGELYKNISDIGLMPELEGESYHRAAEEKLLGGKIVEGKNGDEYIVSNDGRKIPVAFSSSGQQELLPLLRVLSAVRDELLFGEEEFLFIEEPEAHLFPMAQAVLIEYIASFVTDKKNPNKMFITTHSPYILTQINNFIKAGIIANNADEATQKRIGKIVPKEAWLKIGDVIAYTINDGVLESIMDAESGLINAEAIDDVSAIISEQFSKLLDIEHPDV